MIWSVVVILFKFYLFYLLNSQITRSTPIEEAVQLLFSDSPKFDDFELINAPKLSLFQTSSSTKEVSNLLRRDNAKVVDFFLIRTLAFIAFVLGLPTRRLYGKRTGTPRLPTCFTTSPCLRLELSCAHSPTGAVTSGTFHRSAKAPLRQSFGHPPPPLAPPLMFGAYVPHIACVLTAWRR